MLRCKHKRKGLHVPPQEVKVCIWMQAATEASYMLGMICTDDILTLEPSTKTKSRSSNKSKVTATSMESFHVKGGGLGVILADVLK